MSFAQPSFLLPQNRKLRHLRGIYLRNLTFPQPRGYSIDDATINKTSVDKRERALSNHSSKVLHHARSSDNLKTSSSSATPSSHSLSSPATDTQPTRGRRVTLSGANSLARQHILEQALDSSTADAFFSLHCEGCADPLYVSEVEEKATNFNFRFFDLVDLEPFLSRSSQLIIKVWVRRSLLPATPATATWILLVEDDIDLRFLGCIGSLNSIHFPPNALVFHLVDGIYMAGVRSPAVRAGAKKQAAAVPTSSYNSLMRLANLENSVQDCLATQDRLASQINDLLAQEQPPALPEAEARCHRVKKGVAHQRRLTEAARHRRDEIAASIQARRSAISAGRALQKKACADVENASQKLDTSRATAAKTQDSIRGQRRRICEDLIRIFRIVTNSYNSNEPLAFQVCGMPLPNTEYGSSVLTGAQASFSGASGEDVLSAALGYVALLANALQTYLSVALPYRVTAYGSRSVVRDDISKIPDQQREFPLYMPRGGLTSQYRFDYAWFLMNKNIETLCIAQGLRVVDIRHTLPNLKYLLYVCSAGSEELPERKRGGVRGLWSGHIQRHSIASTMSTVTTADDAPSHHNDTADDGAGMKAASPEINLRRGSMETSFTFPAKSQAPAPALSSQQRAASLAMPPPKRPSDIARSPSPVPGLNLPFAEGVGTWTLRTKGMRENIDRRG
ncbi:uv radiation resistance-associated protein [Ophiostoma piceae UAMH 11346]|uniref:Uv radiation resistance-associated protein n=1 Tax=Ophiostoma piceae (strain UAMH 11346) TaxID=1262450 RepID=S3CAE1_OPHP1|nr:uv radiation resistance-associated protein [Ophiostoma piceae UAMH 11346]